MTTPVKLSLADELYMLVTALDPTFNDRVKSNVAMGARFNRLYQALSRVDDTKNMTYRPGKRR
jgi:hypothetical protein